MLRNSPEFKLHDILKEMADTEATFKENMELFVKRMFAFANSLRDTDQKKRIVDFLQPYMVLASNTPISTILPELREHLAKGRLNQATDLACDTLSKKSAAVESAEAAIVKAAGRYPNLIQFWADSVTSQKNFKDPNAPLDMAAYAIQPIQRILRYVLFFKGIEAAANTLPDNADNRASKIKARNALAHVENMGVNLNDEQVKSDLVREQVALQDMKQQLESYANNTKILTDATKKQRQEKIRNILAEIKKIEKNLPDPKNPATSRDLQIVDYLAGLKNDPAVLADKDSTNKHLFNAVNQLHRLYSEIAKDKQRTQRAAHTLKRSQQTNNALPSDYSDKLQHDAEVLAEYYLQLGNAATPIIEAINKLNEDAQTAIDNNDAQWQHIASELQITFGRLLRSTLLGNDQVSLERGKQLLNIYSPEERLLVDLKEQLDKLKLAQAAEDVAVQNGIGDERLPHQDALDILNAQVGRLQALITDLSPTDNKPHPPNYLLHHHQAITEYLDPTGNDYPVPDATRATLAHYTYMTGEDLVGFSEAVVADTIIKLPSKFPHDSPEAKRLMDHLSELDDQLHTRFSEHDFKSAIPLSEYFVAFAAVVNNPESSANDVQNFWQQALIKEQSKENDGDENIARLLQEVGSVAQLAEPPAVAPVVPSSHLDVEISVEDMELIDHLLARPDTEASKKLRAEIETKKQASAAPAPERNATTDVDSNDLPSVPAHLTNTAAPTARPVPHNATTTTTTPAPTPAATPTPAPAPTTNRRDAEIRREASFKAKLEAATRPGSVPPAPRAAATATSSADALTINMVDLSNVFAMIDTLLPMLNTIAEAAHKQLNLERPPLSASMQSFFNRHKLAESTRTGSTPAPSVGGPSSQSK